MVLVTQNESIVWVYKKREKEYMPPSPSFSMKGYSFYTMYMSSYERKTTLSVLHVTSGKLSKRGQSTAIKLLLSFFWTRIITTEMKGNIGNRKYNRKKCKILNERVLNDTSTHP